MAAWGAKKTREKTKMRRIVTISAVSAVALTLTAGAAFAQQFGTAAEAKAMEEKAMAELKANPTAAIAKFNDPSGGFKDRDLYVFCFSTATGNFDAHANKALVGTDVRSLKEKDGAALGQKVFDAAKGAAEGTTVTADYNFPKPGTTNPVPKESFIFRVGNEGCGVGYYK